MADSYKQWREQFPSSAAEYDRYEALLRKVQAAGPTGYTPQTPEEKQILCDQPESFLLVGEEGEAFRLTREAEGALAEIKD